MESKSKILGHPAHQILIVFPLGLLTAAAIFDAIAIAKKDPEKKAKWLEFAFNLIGAGIFGALVAAPFGTRDWLAIPEGTRAKRIGAIHGLSNVTSLLFYGASWLLRRSDPKQTNTGASALLFTGSAISGFAGWLGGELVDRLSVGVDDGAHVNAPSSLSGRPAYEEDDDHTPEVDFVVHGI